jgi:elongation factor G
MKVYETENIRNVVLVGSKGVGKTTLIDNLLFTSGGNTRIGNVDDGSSMLDTDPLELKRQQSMLCKVMPVEWKGCKINVFDTPGYADFVGEAISAIFVADVAAVVVDASSGVEIATKRLFNTVQKFNKPCSYIINKLDGEHANFETAVKSVRDTLSNRAVPIHFPIGAGSSFTGTVDLLSLKAYDYSSGKVKEIEVPGDMKDQVTKARTDIIESVAEGDEALMEKYLESGELSETELKAGVVKGILSGDLQPIMVASAGKNIGMDSLLDSIVTWFPSPSKLPFPKAVKPGTEDELKFDVDAKAPSCAYLFKITSDPGIGDVFFFRVYSGTISHGADLHNSTSRTSERFGHIFIIRGKNREEVPSVVAGDIAAVVKLKGTTLGNTLCDKSNQIEVFPPAYPEPMVSLSVKPKSKQDQDKLGMGLSKFMTLDPTFKMRLDKEFNETIISGVGESHLEVIMEKLKDRFGIELEVGKPRIPYRETIKKTVKVQHKHKKQSGGKGQYGECYLEVSPLSPGSGFEFINSIVGGAIPSKYIPAVEKGVKDSMSKGVLAGYPVVDVKVSVFDGSYHDVDSSDMAFQIAGAMAFKKAETEAAPILIEPIMSVEVTVPKDSVGDVSSDISSRRGRVAGMDHQGALGIVKAQVPLAELYKYSTTLRSMTSGAASHSMSFSHYEAVPSHVVQKIVDETQKAKEAKEAEK